jgi:hypothetical protein
VFLLLACAPAPLSESEPHLPSVTDALAQRGLLVADGEARHLDSDCCLLDTCLLANPDNDYLGWWIPRGPGQAEPNPLEQPDGRSHIWRLRADEAVVAVGLTPPPSGYFSFRTYLDGRWSQQTGAQERVFVNPGDSLNQLAIGTGPGGPFSAPFALVTTADARTLDLVREALLEAGLPAEAINAEPLAADPAILPDRQGPFFGLSAQSDTFRLNVRLSLPEDPELGQAYLDAPPIEVYRVTPAVPQEPQPLSPPPLRPRGTGTTEQPWASAVDELDAALVQSFPDYWALPLSTLASETSAKECPPGCNRDTFFAATLHYLLPADLDVFVMVFGANHERTGKSTYSNFSVIDVEQHASYASVNSRQMVGSARPWLPAHPQVDDLYAWRVARTCEPADPYCIAVPYECPGFASDVQGSIAFRAYLEPETATGPKTEELVPDRALLFVRRPEP